MLKNVRVLDGTGSNSNLTAKKKTTSLNTGTSQNTSFSSALSTSLVSAVSSVAKTQAKTVSNVSKKVTTVSSTSTPTPVVTKVDYSGEIQKVSAAITKFGNADSYFKKALEYLDSGLIINGSNQFSNTINTIKSNNLTELSKLTNEILPEMK